MGGDPIGTRFRSPVLGCLGRFLTEQGLRPHAILPRAGVSEQLIGDERTDMALEDVAEVLDIIARIVGDSAFGLRFGAWSLPGQVGVLDHLVLTSETVHEALERIVSYREVMMFPFDIGLATAGERAVLTGRIPASAQVPSAQFVDMVLAIFVSRLRLAFAPDWLPLAVDLPRPHPDDLGAYHAVFGAAVRFQTSQFAIALWRRDLQARLPAAWPQLSATVQMAADQILAAHQAQSDFSGRVRQAIMDHLAEERDVRLAHVARSLGLSPRAVQWQLGRNNETFAGIVREVRLNTAEKLLGDRAVPIKKISQRLGFSEASTFVRWTRRHFGKTPRAYRLDLLDRQ